MFARTDRLLLRPGWMEDTPALFAAIADEAIVRNLARAPWPYTLDDARAFLSGSQSTLNTHFLVTRRTCGAPQVIGGAGFARNGEDEVELGYWIARPYWGLGYATEAVQAIVDIARNGLRLKTLKAGHFLDNPASARVLEKAGFKPVGDIVEHYSKARAASAPLQSYVCDLRQPAFGNDAKDMQKSPDSLDKAFCMAA